MQITSHQYRSLQILNQRVKYIKQTVKFINFHPILKHKSVNQTLFFPQSEAKLFSSLHPHINNFNRRISIPLSWNLGWTTISDMNLFLSGFCEPRFSITLLIYFYLTYIYMSLFWVWLCCTFLILGWPIYIKCSAEAQQVCYFCIHLECLCPNILILQFSLVINNIAYIPSVCRNASRRI